jgi:hypothetical protein
MSAGLYSGVSGLALGTGLYKNVSGLWSGASGFDAGFGGGSPFSGASLYLNFLAGAPLDPRVTFTRGSNATLVDSTGKITYAPANFFTFSEQFDNAAWLKSNVTITADATTSPDGTVDADLAVPNTTTGTKTVGYQNVAMTAVSYTMSFYAKPSGYDWVYLREDSSGSTRRAYFNVSTGVVGVVSAGLTASITSVGGGWYRCGITFTGAVGTFVAGIWVTNANNTPSLTGDGTSGVFAWGAQLEQVTYQTTPSTYVATTTAAYYGPRFDYDPVTLAPKGLLIEEQRTNLLVQSQTFDSGSWAKSGSTITADATTSPDGTVNADKLVETATTAQHRTAQMATVTSGSAYTFSIYAKAAERTSIWVRMIGTATFATCIVDLTNGAISSTSGTCTATNVGGGWYRITVSGTSDSTTVTAYANLVDGAGATTYTGDGTSGLFIWGAQLEAGAFATSYIPTVASQVTRSADIATMTGTNFSSWYNASEGSFVSSYEASPNTFTTYLAASNGVVAQNSMHMDNDGSGNMRVAYYSGSSAVALLTLGAVGTINAVNNIATAYKVNDFAASRNGGTVVTDTAGAVPVGVNRLNIGADPSGAAVNVSNTHIRQIAYYNTRLPNATLQALTA